MAHGELIMIGAYTTYVVQSLFKSYLSSYVDWYLIAAIPAAFIVSALIGMLIERTVIRPLYGRQLETLLATFGVSLILMQLVRWFLVRRTLRCRIFHGCQGHCRDTKPDAAL